MFSGNAEKETQLKHHTVYLSTMAAVSFLKNAAICRLFNKALLCNLRKQHVAFVLRNYSKILSIEESGSRCGYCLTHHRRTVHMSAGLYVKPKTNKAKKKKENFQVVLRPHMTPTQLAKVCRTNLETIYECLLVSVGNDSFNNPDIVIDNIKLLKDVVKQLELEYTVAQDKTKHSLTAKSQPADSKNTTVTDAVRQPPPDPSVLVKRPPVVTIMGHVDHGKTTLLDALRKSHVVDQEFGGITQHIGAFSVKMKSGEWITFLDTPGHAAFSAMRARGASVTDIVILVIAAEDGVMETTIEAIEHTKEAKVPIIVAINKIDKPEADIEGCKKALLGHDIVVEDFGGDVQVVPISALKGTNLDLLQESIITLSEVMELKGDPVGLVEGHIVEAKTDAKRGKIATALIQRGTLKKGDFLVAGTTGAKVRSMFNDLGKPIEEAPPSAPVEIMGWKDVPVAGDEVLQVDSEKTVRSVIEWRKSQILEQKMAEDMKVISQKRAAHDILYTEKRETRYSKYNRIEWEKVCPPPLVADDKPKLSIVLKCDVQGSLEAILDSLNTYDSNMCKLDIVSHGVGDVTEHDIQMAEMFNGMIYAFNVGMNANGANMPHEVPIKHFQVIYKMFDDLVDTLSNLLPPLEVEEVVGEADVLQVFQVKEGKKKVTVGGCKCSKGRLFSKNLFQVIRNEDIIFKGQLKSLKHHKNEVDTIGSGTDCGVCLDMDSNSLNTDSDIQLQVGDQIQCLEIREEEQEIDWSPGF